MTVGTLKKIIKNLDDDMSVKLKVEDEDYNVISCDLTGYNTYDGENLELEGEADG